MTTAQKVIKYLAIAFAIFLIIVITSTLVMGIYGLSSLFGKKQESTTSTLETINCQYNDFITNLEIDLEKSNLEIKVGDSFIVQTNNKNIVCNKKDNQLEIKEKDKKFEITNDYKTLIIYIPKSLYFNEIEVDTGIGNVNIDYIKANILSLNLGIGETTINDILSNIAKIETGVGKVNINSGNINNLDMDTGIGEVNVISKITGSSKIDAGIGNLNLYLLGNENDYKLNINKGIGNILINGNSVGDKQIIGNGISVIDVDGGIGKININYKQ